MKFLNSFVLKRVHSLTGLFLLLFLIEHILTNSQATLFIGNDGKGFLDGVKMIHSLPYVHVIEILFIGVPLALHVLIGLKFLLTTKYNSFPSNGAKPYLNYGRNHAFTWQRVTAWILIVGVLLHVLQMRFLEQPLEFKDGVNSKYLSRVVGDNGLYSLSKRLNVEIYDQSKINSFKENKTFAELLQKKQLTKNQVIAVSPNFATAILLLVRNTFQSTWMIILYAFFVLAASFHALNGLWTLLITWGITLTDKAQKLSWKAVLGLMVVTIFLGISALGVYWLNLYK